MISSVNKGFDKETFKKNVIYNVKSQFRKTIDEATPNQVFQAVAYAVKVLLLMSGLQRTRSMKSRMLRPCITCPWNF